MGEVGEEGKPGEERKGVTQKSGEILFVDVFPAFVCVCEVEALNICLGSPVLCVNCV